jgi:hypothetical protein
MLRAHESCPHCHDTLLWYAVTLQVCTHPNAKTRNLSVLVPHKTQNYSNNDARQWQARRALATLVAQLFCCPDGEHWQLFCCGNRKVAAWCGLTHSRGNRKVADNDRTHVFQSVRAHWQLNCCLLAAIRCTSLVSKVIRLCLSSRK